MQPRYEQPVSRSQHVQRDAFNAGMKNMLEQGLLGLVVGVGASALLALFGLGVPFDFVGSKLGGALVFGSLMGTMFGASGFASGHQAVISYEKGRDAGIEEVTRQQAMAHERQPAQTRSASQERAHHRQHAAAIEAERNAASDITAQR